MKNRFLRSLASLAGLPSGYEAPGEAPTAPTPGGQVSPIVNFPLGGKVARRYARSALTNGILQALARFSRAKRGKGDPQPPWEAYGDHGRLVRGTGFAVLDNGQWVRA
jgi:hypothetical protein